MTSSILPHQELEVSLSSNDILPIWGTTEEAKANLKEAFLAAIDGNWHLPLKTGLVVFKFSSPELRKHLQCVQNELQELDA